MEKNGMRLGLNSATMTLGSTKTVRRKIEDPTYRLAVDPEIISGLMDNLGTADVIYALYVWLTTGKYGIQRSTLRKKLGCGNDELNEFIEKFVSRGILRERTKNSEGHEISIAKRRITAGYFPGILKVENEGDISQRSYKIDIEYFTRCFNTWKTDKTMMNYLGYCFKLFPSLDQTYGFVCENPRQEWLKHIVPMKRKKAAEILGVSQTTASRFFEACPTQWKTSSRPVCLGGDGKLKSGKKVFMLNPLLFYHKDTDPMIFFWKWGEGSDDLTIVDFDHESPIQRR